MSEMFEVQEDRRRLGTNRRHTWKRRRQEDRPVFDWPVDFDVDRRDPRAKFGRRRGDRRNTQ